MDADFVVLSNTCTGGLALGATCAISVAYAPTVVGGKNATLTVSSTTGGSVTAVLFGSASWISQDIGDPTPAGGVTFGSVASGPLVGVVTAVDALECTSALSALFWLPTVIVLDPPEPQPAISPASASADSPAVARRNRRGEGLK